MKKNLILNAACIGAFLGILIGAPIAGLLGIHDAVRTGAIVVDYTRIQNPFMGFSLRQLAEYPVVYRG